MAQNSQDWETVRLCTEVQVLYIDVLQEMRNITEEGIYNPEDGALWRSGGGKSLGSMLKFWLSDIYSSLFFTWK